MVERGDNIFDLNLWNKAKEMSKLQKLVESPFAMPTRAVYEDLLNFEQEVAEKMKANGRIKKALFRKEANRQT